MPGQKQKQQRESLGRFLAYVLGIRPDEFGLVPDEEGWVPIKDLLAALSEEEGWRHVREGNIHELLREPDGSGFEVRDRDIRRQPEFSSLELGFRRPVDPPKLLFHATRRRAYPVFLEHGLAPTTKPYVTLATTPELAWRLGRRRDPEPVPLTILAGQARAAGIVFTRPQELIYLVSSLPPEFFTGPPLPKEKAETDKKKKHPQAAPDLKPGSFVPDASSIFDQTRRPDKNLKKKKGDEPDWKKGARQERRKRDRGDF